jgi:biotin carboxylase
MKKTAVVLGGTLPHISLIEKLKNRGYCVVLIDYLAEPPAQKIADFHIQASTLDKEEVLRISEYHSAELVISSCVDQANVTAAYVSEKLGLPHAYSHDVALSATDKTLMKQKFQAGHVPSARYQVLQDVDMVESIDIDFPAIVKPADSNSSKGVRRVNDLEELCEAFITAKKISRNGKVVVEEFIEGIEIGADFVVLAGKAHYLTSKERLKISRAKGGVEQITGCIWPSPSFNKLRNKVIIAAQKIVDEFGFSNTPLMLQGIIHNEVFYVIEFGARLGGGESFRLVNEVCGVDYLELSIKGWLGEKCSFKVSESKSYFSDTFIYSDTGTFARVDGLEEMKYEGLIEYYNLYKKSGSQLSGALSSSDRLGVFVCKGTSLEELADKKRQVLSRIRVVSQEDTDLLRRELYQFS